MKLLNFCLMPLLFTAAIIFLSAVLRNLEFQFISTLLISGIWIGSFYFANKNNKNYEVVVERVNLLKKFSLELQSLVNKELTLVQEDVLRIRGIVTDSIHILQISMKSIDQEISHELVDQTLKCEELIGEIESSASDSQTIIKKDQASLLPDYHLIQDNIRDVIQALQFEDLVSQVSEQVAQHIGDIRVVVDILSRLYESEFSETFDEDIMRMQSELTNIHKKLAIASAKKSVAQHNMNEGDIELF